jgi:inositol hexakisphosphate
MSPAEDTPVRNGSVPNCPLANSGMIYRVLDAPAAKDGETPPSSSSPPRNFRTMTGPWHNPPPGPPPPSRAGLDTLNASGSAQFCKDQLKAMKSYLVEKGVTMPITIVDLRQESHGFFGIKQPIAGELVIAVGWYAERDWMSIGKELPSVEYDENQRLNSSMLDPDLQVYEIKTETEEGGICTAKSYPVQMTSWFTEQQLATALGAGYLRLPSTDHVRPRDNEVDQFVAFHIALPKPTWLHFHCRGGDGRTTTFLAMHDIIHNYPQVSLTDILRRQYWLGGINLASAGATTSFKYPFAVERAKFIEDFATYVLENRPDFNVTWSAWVTSRIISPPLPPSPG